MDTIQDKLRQAGKLLAVTPATALARVEGVLVEHPDNSSAQQIKGTALRLLGQTKEALAVFSALEKKLPDSAPLHHELGLCFGALGDNSAAEKHLRQAVKLEPGYSNAWLSLSNQLDSQGDKAASRAALEYHLQTSTKHPELVQAARHLDAGELAKAEPIIKQVLKQYPTDVSAIRMLADLAMRLERFEDASHLLERCLELAPDFTLARQNYASVLRRIQRHEEALVETEKLLREDPENPRYLILKASVLTQLGQNTAAVDIFEKVVTDYPNQPAGQMSYGHNLKTLGRVDEAITAYRRTTELSPTTGEAYWSLANLKTYRFTDDEIDTMRATVTSGGGDADDQSHLAFALGKGLEDRKAFDESFQFYKRGNNIRRIHHSYDPKRNMYNAVRQIKTCTEELFTEKGVDGCAAPDPIFVVGLPRAGSTLLEQILASHSQVQGTTELADIIAISRKLGGRDKSNPATLYPEILADLSPEQRMELGQGYLDSTRIHRNDLPFFVDKMPNNWLHVGLIHLILPNAKIIDARRHPMAGCFACYKQLFAHGQTFTYKLEDVGHYYRNYFNVMEHWDKVLPGKVLRVQYEDMVADSETQIRRVLEYCGLPFEEQCLRFYETDRAVRTPSSEQVRQPIFKEGLEQWRNYEEHLDLLKEALGPLLQSYPI
ncbi:MAG: sulfotransferase [Halioglobus sp.]